MGTGKKKKKEDEFTPITQQTQPIPVRTGSIEETSPTFGRSLPLDPQVSPVNQGTIPAPNIVDPGPQSPQEAAEREFNQGLADLRARTDQQLTSDTTGSGTKEALVSRDGTGVVYRIGDEDFRFTEREYQAFLGKAGQLTDNVQAALDKRNQPTAEEAALQDSIGATRPFVEGEGISELDKKQALLATITDPSGIRSILAAGTAGAAAGGFIGGLSGIGIGAAPGAIIGGSIGVTVGIFEQVKKNIEDQKADDLTSTKAILTDGQRNLLQLAALANVEPENAPQYIEQFNDQLNILGDTHSKVKFETQTNLNLALGLDGTRELARYQTFYASGGYRDISVAKMQQALASPNIQEGAATLLLSQNLSPPEELAV